MTDTAIATIEVNAPLTTGQITDSALKNAVKAEIKSATSNLDAALAICFFMAMKQVGSDENRTSFNKKDFEAHWRGYLKRYAMSGFEVWQNTQHVVDRFAAMKYTPRSNAASDYIDKKAKGETRKLNQPLQQRKTLCKNLVEDLLTNRAGIARDIIAHRDAGMDYDTIYGKFAVSVKNAYGDTYAAMCRYFKKETPPRDDDEIKRILEKAEKMTLTELKDLLGRIKDLYDRRETDEADIGGMDSGEMHVEMTSPPVLKEVAYTTRDTIASEAARDARLDAKYGVGYAAKLKASKGGPISMGVA